MRKDKTEIYLQINMKDIFMTVQSLFLHIVRDFYLEPPSFTANSVPPLPSTLQLTVVIYWVGDPNLHS